MAARVHHPNLVQFIGACMDEEMIILLELMPISLHKYLVDRAPARPSASFCTSVCLDVSKALNYLHLMQLILLFIEILAVPMFFLSLFQVNSGELKSQTIAL